MTAEMRQLVESGESSPEPYARYPGLSWKRPRTLHDYVEAYIKFFSAPRTSSPKYEGLFDENEFLVYENQRQGVRDAWHEKVTPENNLDSERKRWQHCQRIESLGAGGNLFESKGSCSLPAGSIRQGVCGIVSFSPQMTRIDSFFRLVMKEITEGKLAEFPLEFGIHDVSFGLCFPSRHENEVYKAVVDRIYPAMVEEGLTAFGGRVLMVPVLDRHSEPLMGVEFGQDLAPRSGLWKQFPERANIRSSWTTSGVINRVNQRIFWFFRDNPEAFSLLRGGIEPTQLVQKVQDDLGELGRNHNFPILDIDALDKFPSFTKSIIGK